MTLRRWAEISSVLSLSTGVLWSQPTNPLAPAVGGLNQTNGPPAAAATNAAPLAPVVVTASPLPSSLFDLAQPVTVLSGEKLRSSLAQTLGETIGREPGISSTYHGPNASRPVIRGLEGDHIRLLQNGIGNMDVSSLVRDHAVASDPLTYAKIEVVRGPAALLYGPTAVGGVVNVIDNRIPDARIERPMTGRVEGRYDSTDAGRSGAGVVEGGYEGFNYHLDGFVRANDDLSIPGFARSERLRAREPLSPGSQETRGTLPNSQARSDGEVAGLSYVWGQGYAGGSFQGYNNNYGEVAEEDATLRMHQRRFDLAGAFYEPADWVQSVKWKFGDSDYRHREFEGNEPGTIFQLAAFNGRLEVLHNPWGRFEGALGYEVRRDDLKIQGDEAFMPPNISLVNSVFLFEEVAWDQVRLQVGGRIDQSGIDASASPQFGPARSRSFTTGSGAAGLVYRPVDDYSAALNFSYTQRAPVSQELFANGPDLGTHTFELGDNGLQPERSYGLDWTMRKERGRITGAATVFYTHFENFISLTPRGTNDPAFGLPVFDFSGIPADFLGGEGSVRCALVEAKPHQLQLELKTDYVRATATRADDPLPRIPPWRFGAELSYAWKERLGATLEVQRAQSQHRIAPNELPTDGYTMLNLAATYRLGTGPVTWDLLVKGSNLLNVEARVHTSLLKDIAPLAGRGALVALRATF